MKGINIAEAAHLIQALPPISLAGGKTSDSWSMRDHDHVDIIVMLGASVNVSQITVFENSDFAAGGEAAIPFAYYQCMVADGDVLGTRQAATAAGFASASAATNDTMYVISVDAAELSEGKPIMSVKLTSAGAQLGSVLAVLSGSRYGKEQSATEIA